jgi:hypothetical protein
MNTECTAWETLNKKFERKYKTAATITVRPSDADMNEVIKFIENCTIPDFIELGALWLFKFQSFIDENTIEPTVLRPRTAALRTKFFINGSGLQDQCMPCEPMHSSIDDYDGIVITFSCIISLLYSCLTVD